MSGHAGGRGGSKRPGELRISPAARRPPFVVFFSIVWAQTRTTTDGHHVTKMHRIGCTVSMCCLTLSLSLCSRRPGAAHRYARTTVSPHPPQEARSCNSGRSCQCVGLLVVLYRHPGVRVRACGHAAPRASHRNLKTISRISNNNKNNKSNTQWSAPRRPIPPAASPSLRGVKSPTLGLKPRSQC